MDVRQFKERDRAALREVYLESRKHAFTWLEPPPFLLHDFDRDTDGETIWVALASRKPLGFLSLAKPENFIHNLFIHPDHLGRGFGSTLLKEALASIGRPVTLKCLALNTHARDFYLAKGWSVVGRGNGKDGEYLLMEFNETKHPPA